MNMEPKELADKIIDDVASDLEKKCHRKVDRLYEAWEVLFGYNVHLGSLPSKDVVKQEISNRFHSV